MIMGKAALLTEHAEREKGVREAAEAVLGIKLRCPACQGAFGGRQTSDKKARAARRNAKRPRPRPDTAK